MASDGSYEGYLYLWFSLYAPDNGDITTSSIFSVSDEIEYWLIKEFLCGSDEIISIRLVQDTLLTNTCLDKSFDRKENLRKRRRLALPSDVVVLWNSPRSNVTEHYLQSSEEEEYEETQASLRYTSWNVSFPVFDWGSANKNPRVVQKDVQHLLEQKIWQKDLGVPIVGSGVSVQGDEEDFWALRPPTMAPSMIPQPEEVIPLLPRPRAAIDPIEARNLIYIGALLIVVQTILSMLLYQYGQNFRAIQKEQEELKKERESLDQMLRSSNGFVEIDRSLNTIDPSEPLEASERFVTKEANGEWYVARNTSTVNSMIERSKYKKKRRRSSHKHHKEMDSKKSPPSSPTNQKDDRKALSFIHKRRRSSEHKNRRRHSDEVVVDNNAPPRRHEVGKTKKRHSHQSRQKRQSLQGQDRVSFRMSEGVIDDGEVLLQNDDSSPTASVGPTGKVETRRKHHHRHYHHSSKLRMIDDIQLL